MKLHSKKVLAVGGKECIEMHHSKVYNHRGLKVALSLEANDSVAYVLDVYGTAIKYGGKGKCDREEQGATGMTATINIDIFDTQQRFYPLNRRDFSMKDGTIIYNFRKATGSKVARVHC